MAELDKEWLVKLDHPLLPLGLSITRMASTDEVQEVLMVVKSKLPEWRATTIDLNQIIRDLDRASRSKR